MAFEFKKLSDVEVVAEPLETANVLIEENGVIKKAPKTAVGGAGNDEWDAVIECGDLDEGKWCNLISGDFATLRDKIMVDLKDPKVLVRSEISRYGNNYQIGAAKAIYYQSPDSGVEFIKFIFWGEGYNGYSPCHLTLESDNTLYFY